MRRSIYLIIASLAVVGVAYFAYWFFEPTPPAVATRSRETSEPLPAAPNVRGDRLKDFGPGHSAWMEVYDEAKGALSSRFRADEYVPRKNGTIWVRNPVSEFYLAGHQHLEVDGVDGEVVMQDVPDLQKTAVGRTGMPNRGRINHVVMKLLENEPLPGKDPLILTLTTNNIAFDNETFRITTEAYTAPDGSTVEADQVPVHVVGDYEFDGRGLTLRWNDRDGRLELLEIAHGERLVINHPGSGGMTPGHLAHPDPSAPPLANSSSRADPRSDFRNGPKVLEVSDNAIVATHPATQPAKPSRAPSQTIYAATFYDSVKVTQGTPVLMTGDSMRVNFRLKGGENESTGPTTHPATQPAGPATAPGRAPTTAPAVATSSPSTQPSTESAEVPVVVTWTGKLRIIPTTNPPRAIAPGDAVMEMFGSSEPALARRSGSAQQEGIEARAASLLYQTSDGSASLYGSDAFPTVSLTRLPPAASPDARPSVVTSHQIDYTGVDRIAVLHGSGHATFPLAAARPGAPSTQPASPKELDAAWQHEGKLFFAGHGRDEMILDHAQFVGDVDVEHPQLKLQSQALELQFAPAAPRPAAVADAETPASDDNLPATQPATRPAAKPQTELKRVIATGDVHMRLTDTAGKRQWIECARLDMRTAQSPDGKMYPHEVYANGTGSVDARAFDDSQDLQAGEIHLTLRPSTKATTRPATAPAEPAQIETAAVELEQMTALQRVLVTGHDGGKASADELHVVMENDEPHVTLTGQSLARVWDAKENLVTGPKITLFPKRGEAHVEGPGNLHMVHVEEANANGGTTRPATQPAVAKSRPIKVIWSDHADIDGQKNAIDVYGKVESSSPDSDGAINSSNSDHLHIDLRKKLAPETKPAVVAAATTKPAGPNGPMQMDLFKDKEATLITLDHNASVNSTLADANGKILRQFELQGPKILYALVATPDLPAHSLLVPSAGQMLVRDHRPPDAKVKKDDDAAGMGSGRGATAFSWTRQLLYTEEARRADMTGKVLIVHKGDDPKDLPARINAEHVTAFFQPAKKTDAAPAAAPVGQAGPMELKWLTAADSVFVTRGTDQLTAIRIDMDPATHWLHAYGKDRDQAVFTDTATNDTTAADQIDWNTQTWDMKFKNIFTRARRSGK